MRLAIRILKNSLPRDASKRTRYIEHIYSGLEAKIPAISNAVEAQGLSHGTVDGGTVVISSGLHTSSSSSEKHLTARMFVSTGQYAAGVHFFETKEATFRLAGNDSKKSKWKNSELKDRISELEDWVGRWPAE